MAAWAESLRMSQQTFGSQPGLDTQLGKDAKTLRYMSMVAVQARVHLSLEGVPVSGSHILPVLMRTQEPTTWAAGLVIS